MHVGIVPYKLRKTKKLGHLQVDQLIRPLKKPSNALHVRDLGKNDHIVICLRTKSNVSAIRVSKSLYQKNVHKHFYQYI